MSILHKKCEIIYNNSTQIYSYNRENVNVIKLKQTIDPETVVFKYKGNTITNATQIRDFGDFYRVILSDKKEISCKYDDVQISQNCISNGKSKELFQYFKDTAAAIGLKTESGINILSNKYNKITAVEDNTVLGKFIDPVLYFEKAGHTSNLIFPFGLNQSQKKAVENAFSSQISIIQGPPGTGKTQTILNIIVNAVLNKKSVAVVSNNNSATSNIAEKMKKHGLSFITAFLGNLENKICFLQTQSSVYPDMQSWTMEKDEKRKLHENVTFLSEELNIMLNSRNRIAEIDHELLSLKPEQFYFKEYYDNKQKNIINLQQLSKLTSKKLISLWLEYEQNSGNKVGLLKKLMIAIRFNRASIGLFSHIPQDAIPYIQNIYYKNKISELQEEKRSLEIKLNDYKIDDKMKELENKSMQLFKAELACRYKWNKPRQTFLKTDLEDKPGKFNKEYPVILSTTYSIKDTLSTDYIYDYVIIDEASQVDLVTGVLTFSCAKNIIIVGDQKQLPNVLTSEDTKKADEIWYKYNLDERYRFTSHSLLASATEIWKDAPKVLLREHYRCHPKIANFFNQKFYNGQLIIMTEDQDEEDVLYMYRTVPGNHARGHMNQRQIDVIKKEILPTLIKQGYKDIGIITPYQDQVQAIQQQLGDTYEIATVHKFQGREKEAIVLTSVDNSIGKFTDDPNLLNVAVSRAIKSLSVVISDSTENEKTNYGDLAKYIEYNNFQVVKSQIISVFDLLYKDYYKHRKAYLQKHKRVSEYDSENLAYAVIEKILKQPEFSNVDCAVHTSVSTLIRDYSLLTEKEIRYVSNPLTHLDFLLFNKINKKPIMAIEVDGTKYHTKGSSQYERDMLKNIVLDKYNIPLLRIRTDESEIQKHITEKLNDILNQ